jgi:hypothetical protein
MPKPIVFRSAGSLVVDGVVCGQEKGDYEYWELTKDEIGMMRLELENALNSIGGRRKQLGGK